MASLDLKKIFNKEFNEALVHQVTTDYLSNHRAGTKAQKNRSLVSGGGAKPRPQKVQVEQELGQLEDQYGEWWRNFCIKPKNYNKKINKKMYKIALNCIFSELLRRKKLHCVDDFNTTDSKTKSFTSRNEEIKVSNSLFIVHEEKINVFLAGRNIKNVEVVSPLGINPFNLMKHDDVVIDSKLLKNLRILQ